MKLVIALLFVSAVAHAEPVTPEQPYTLAATAGARFMTGTSYPELGITGSRRWWDRVQTGARVTLGRGADSTVLQGLAEVGVVLHPSRRVDLLLAWRAGVAYHRITFPSGMLIPVTAAVVEPVLELGFRIGAATEIRVMPFSVAAHNSGMWLFVFSTDIAVARRF